MAGMKIGKNLIFVAVAVVLGALAALSAMHYVRQAAESARSKEKPHTVQVAVPVRSLNKGDILTADDLAARAVPTDFVPTDAITPDNYQSYVGGVVTMPLAQGVPVPARAVESLANHFSDVIKPGDVAVTMQVDDVNSISGMIVPGDRIDILLTIAGTKDNPQTRPLLGNVLVLATGQQTRGVQEQAGAQSGASHAYSDITLEMAPTDAQRLAVAGKVGSLSVWLRHAGSTSPLELGTLTRAELLGEGLAGRRTGPGIQFIIGGRG